MSKRSIININEVLNYLKISRERIEQINKYIERNYKNRKAMNLILEELCEIAWKLFKKYDKFFKYYDNENCYYISYPIVSKLLSWLFPAFKNTSAIFKSKIVKYIVMKLTFEGYRVESFKYVRSKGTEYLLCKPSS